MNELTRPRNSGAVRPWRERYAQKLLSAAEAIERCPCRAGCPSCVGAGGEAGREGKAAALAILKRIDRGNT